MEKFIPHLSNTMKDLWLYVNSELETNEQVVRGERKFGLNVTKDNGQRLINFYIDYRMYFN